MKVAVLIIGMFREFKSAIKSWDFLDHLDHDVYFSTWGVSTEDNEKLNICLRERIYKHDILRILPNANIVMDAHFIYDNHLSIQNMLHRIDKGLSAIYNSNKKYDAILMIRPDLHLDINLERLQVMLDAFDKTKIYNWEFSSEQPNDINGVNDWLLLGAPEMFKRLVKPHKEVTDIHGRVVVDGDIHRWLMYTFEGCIEPMYIFNAWPIILRSNSRGADPKDYGMLSSKWTDIKYH